MKNQNRWSLLLWLPFVLTATTSFASALNYYPVKVTEKTVDGEHFYRFEACSLNMSDCVRLGIYESYPESEVSKLKTMEEIISSAKKVPHRVSLYNYFESKEAGVLASRKLDLVQSYVEFLGSLEDSEEFFKAASVDLAENFIGRIEIDPLYKKFLSTPSWELRQKLVSFLAKTQPVINNHFFNSDYVTKASLSTDGKTMAVATNAGTFRIYGLGKTSKLLCEFNVGGQSTIELSEDGSVAIGASTEGIAKIIRIQDQQCTDLYTVNKPGELLRHVTISRDGRSMAITNDYGKIWGFKYLENKIVDLGELDLGKEFTDIFYVTSVNIAAYGSRMAVSFGRKDDGQTAIIQFYDDTFQYMDSVPTTCGATKSRLSEDGETIAVGSSCGEFTIASLGWSRVDLTYELKKSNYAVSALSASPDGRYFFATYTHHRSDGCMRFTYEKSYEAGVTERGVRDPSNCYRSEQVESGNSNLFLLQPFASPVVPNSMYTVGSIKDLTNFDGRALAENKRGLSTISNDGSILIQPLELTIGQMSVLEMINLKK